MDSTRLLIPLTTFDLCLTSRISKQSHLFRNLSQSDIFPVQTTYVRQAKCLKLPLSPTRPQKLTNNSKLLPRSGRKRENGGAARYILINLYGALKIELRSLLCILLRTRHSSSRCRYLRAAIYSILLIDHCQGVHRLSELVQALYVLEA